MLSFRKFEKESDYFIMHRIVQHKCSQTGHLYPQLHTGNLDFERYAFAETPDILYETTWFILDCKNEIGFITSEEDEFYITILPEFQHHMQTILDFIEQSIYSCGAGITTEANSKDMLLTEILEKRGYTRTENFRYTGICELSKISRQSPLANGYIIRHTNKTDAPRRAELFDLATGGIGTTAQRYDSMMDSVSYCNALDLVVESSNREVIAYCTIWDDPISRIATLEPVACVAEHRRKGITKSLLLYGMNIIKERGTKYIYVGTGGNNIPSQMLYKSVGFVAYGKNHEWEKTL
jgi:predicted N-acetyltransferase YhbS